MVISRGGAELHPGIKESGISQDARPITRRVAELPSLRYGSVGARTANTGPLRVASYYYNGGTEPTRKKRSGNIYPSDDSYKPRRAPRRVRFTLPTTDGGACPTDDAEPVGVAAKSKAGECRPPRTRATFSSQRSDARRSESAVRCYPADAHDARRRQQRFVEFSSPLTSSTSKGVSVPVTASPGARNRIHPTGRYVRGTLSPTASASPLAAAASPGGQTLLKAARDGNDHLLKDLLRRAVLVGIAESDLNAVDSSGRTVLSYIASNGSIDLLDQILQLPSLNPNKSDNEGNTPLHFAAQAGQVECVNCMLSRCRGIEIDARNNLGFTPLMKAALQGRNKCAKLLLFAGANPTLRDNGRGFRADQWARFCGRYVCADVIEKYARQRLLERSTSYGNWGVENELGARVLMGKVVPVPPIPQQPSNGLRSKLRKVFRTSSGLGRTNDAFSSARLVTQLTSAALCASSPVLPSAPSVPPVVKSLIRPLTVPKLQITLVNNNGDHPNNNLAANGATTKTAPPPTISRSDEEKIPAIKPLRTKKKK